ncbi:MAG: hypothetical protein V3V28_13740 [Polaribacter sp.]|uniref:hypothetical protein n=1 Tax=Polaribacter sp. TaxID=1920175 RepID=UPI002F357D77
MKSVNKKLLLLFTCLLVFSSCCSDCNKDKKEVTKPTNLLTYKEIASMLQHYDANKKQALMKAFGKEDSRVINIPVEQLKNYIAYVEKLSKEKEIKLTSINFVMASYPENYKDEKVREFQTFFYIPATSINGETRVSFDPLHSTKGKPALFRDILQKYNYTWTYDSFKQPKMMENKAMMFQQTIDRESSAGNRSHISPPM